MQIKAVALNGAGIRSNVATSKSITVLPGNTAGTILDGRSDEDEDYSNDRSTIAASFTGFSSVACGIVGYEWGAGTSPFATDILPYSEFGLVVQDEDLGSGTLQGNLMLFEGVTYYVTVRARTGPNCYEPYIVSASDGITIDTTPPSVDFWVIEADEYVGSTALPLTQSARQLTSNDVVYQTQGDRLAVGWRVSDSSGVNMTELSTDTWGSNAEFRAVGAISTVRYPLDIQALSGESVLSTLVAVDGAGNEMMTWLPLVTVDVSVPSFVNLTCTEVVSSIASLVKCSWLTVDEFHSSLETIEFGVGSGPSFPDLLNMTSVPVYSQDWKFDVDDLNISPDAMVFYVIARAANGAGLKSEVQIPIRRDFSPPNFEGVFIVTSAKSGLHVTEQKCQTSQEYMEVLVTGVSDSQSGVQRCNLLTT